MNKEADKKLEELWKLDYSGSENLFNKMKDAGFNVSIKYIRDWLAKQDIAQIYHRPSADAYAYNSSFNVTIPNKLHQIDLLYA